MLPSPAVPTGIEASVIASVCVVTRAVIAAGVRAVMTAISMVVPVAA